MPWIDRLKALAILWILLNHVVERLVGGAYAANPSVPWPPLAVRVAQFAPVHGARLANWPLTIVRDLGWFGAQGVTLFLMLSGFGLTWGALRSRNPGALDLPSFYRRRFARILPLWWGVNVLFLLTSFILRRGLSLADWHFYASLAGLRFIPGVFYYFAPAWWFIGLIIQLYLVYPWLYSILRARGPLVLLLLGCGIGFVSIALGPYLFHNSYLDAWQRGAFFVTRLPDFTLGMALAAWWSAAPARVEALLTSPLVWLAALATYLIGTALSFTLIGMIAAPAMLGASAFVLLYPLVRRRAPADGVFQRLGRDSYALYLVHHPFVQFLVPSVLAAGRATVGKVALLIVLALVATALATALLMWGVETVERAFRPTHTRPLAATDPATVAATGFVTPD